MELILALSYAPLVLSLLILIGCGIAFLRIKARNGQKRVERQAADTWIGELDPEMKKILG